MCILYIVKYISCVQNIFFFKLLSGFQKKFKNNMDNLISFIPIYFSLSVQYY